MFFSLGFIESVMELSNKKYWQADKVNHNQSFNDFKASCDDVKVNIPNPLTENTNRAPNYGVQHVGGSYEEQNMVKETCKVVVTILLVGLVFG